MTTKQINTNGNGIGFSTKSHKCTTTCVTVSSACYRPWSACLYSLIPASAGIYIQSNLPSRPPPYGGHLLIAASGHTFVLQKAKMNLLSRPQLFFSARYNVGNCKKNLKSDLHMTYIWRPPLYGGHFCQVPRVVAIDRFDCIYKLFKISH